MKQYSYKDELTHFGVLGMKWGKLKGSKDKKIYSKKRVKAKYLSNDELKSRINRLELEQRYNNLSKKKISASRKAVGDLLSNIGKNTITSVASNRLAGTINKTIDELIGTKK